MFICYMLACLSIAQSGTKGWMGSSLKGITSVHYIT